MHEIAASVDCCQNEQTARCFLACLRNMSQTYPQILSHYRTEIQNYLSIQAAPQHG